MKYYYGDEIMEDEMCGTWSTHWQTWDAYRILVTKPEDHSL